VGGKKDTAERHAGREWHSKGWGKEGMYPDIVVAACSCKAPFCAGLEMRAVDGLQVVEMVDEGLCAHDCGACRRCAAETVERWMSSQHSAMSHPRTHATHTHSHLPLSLSESAAWDMSQ
jgi:hypothetical protein